MLKQSRPRRGKFTTIWFCEGDPYAHITTSSPGFVSKLVARGYFPMTEGERETKFIIPKKALSIRRPRGQG